MNYLHDKRNRDKHKTLRTTISVAVVLTVLLSSSVMFHRVSSGSMLIARPLWKLGGFVDSRLHSWASYFASKNALYGENKWLREENERLRLNDMNTNALLDENTQLKDVLGRVKEKNVLLGVVISRPGQSLYDTMIVDVGSAEGVVPESKVFAGGDALIGKVSEVFAHTSKISLYSAPDNKVDGVTSDANIPVTLIGQGGGNFKIDLPRETQIPIGTTIVFPNITTYVLGTVGDVTFDPRDPFQTVLVTGPVNVQQIRFVEIEK